jgi:hypothetical protein
MHSRSTLVVLVGILFGNSVAIAQQHPAAGPKAVSQTPKVGKPVEFGAQHLELKEGGSTTVLGTIPKELEGVWLVAEDSATSSERTYSKLQVYEIKRTSGNLQANLLKPTLPTALVERYKQAQKSGQKADPPTPAELQEVAAVLAKDWPQPDPGLSILYQFRAADRFSDVEKKGKESAGAKAVLEIVATPYSEPLYGYAYYFTSLSKNEIDGKHTLTVVPVTPQGVPVAASVSGTFRMFRLDVPPAASTGAADPTPAKHAQTH